MQKSICAHELVDETSATTADRTPVRFGYSVLIKFRIVAESGAGTASSVFSVNAYSGTRLLGEGVGITLSNAKKQV